MRPHISLIRPYVPLLFDRPRTRRGAGLVEILVVIVVVSILSLLLMLGLTRSREVARSVTCSRNLQQIGLAIELYHQSGQQLPYIASLNGTTGSTSGPLALMLEQLGLNEVTGIDERVASADLPPPTEPISERYLPEFVCPSDPIATSRVFPAPISYRANTGDRVDGGFGPFAPGASITLDEVEAHHGASYTVAFSERLVGTDGSSNERLRDYQVVPAPVSNSGCPELPNDSALQTDAGQSWLELGWRSTLYSHASRPQAPRSCIASDGRTALMGASSGHVEGVRVLFLDGSVRIYATTVAPPVWAALGTYRDLESKEDVQAASDDEEPLPQP